MDSWSSGSTPLMEEGILLTNYYSTPIKGAALTSLLSGKYPHKSQPLTSDSLNCSFSLLLLGGLLRYFLHILQDYQVFSLINLIYFQFTSPLTPWEDKFSSAHWLETHHDFYQVFINLFIGVTPPDRRSGRPSKEGGGPLNNLLSGGDTRTH